MTLRLTVSLHLSRRAVSLGCFINQNITSVNVAHNLRHGGCNGMVGRVSLFRLKVRAS